MKKRLALGMGGLAAFAHLHIVGCEPECFGSLAALASLSLDDCSPERFGGIAALAHLYFGAARRAARGGARWGPCRPRSRGRL